MDQQQLTQIAEISSQVPPITYQLPFEGSAAAEPETNPSESQEASMSFEFSSQFDPDTLLNFLSESEFLLGTTPELPLAFLDSSLSDEGPAGMPAPTARCNDDNVGVPPRRVLSNAERRVLDTAVSGGAIPTSTRFPLPVENLNRLLSTAFLDDDTIGHLAQLSLTAFNANGTGPRCFFLNSFFLEKLERNELSADGTNILHGELLFDGEGQPLFDHVFIAYQRNLHWYLIDVAAHSAEILFVDALNCSGEYAEEFAERLRQWLNEYCLKDTCGEVGIDEDKWQARVMEAPQQQDGWSCGRFIVYFLRCLITGEPLQMVRPEDVSFYNYQLALDAVTHVLNYQQPDEYDPNSPILDQVHVRDNIFQFSFSNAISSPPPENKLDSTSPSATNALPFESFSSPFAEDLLVFGESEMLPEPLFMDAPDFKEYVSKLDAVKPLRKNMLAIAMFFNPRSLLCDLAEFVVQYDILGWGTKAKDDVKKLMATLTSTLFDDHIRSTGTTDVVKVRRREPIPEEEHWFQCINERDCEDLKHHEKGKVRLYDLTVKGQCQARALLGLLDDDIHLDGTVTFGEGVVAITDILSSSGALTIKELSRRYKVVSHSASNASALEVFVKHILLNDATNNNNSLFANYHGYWFVRENAMEALARRWITPEQRALGMEILRPMVVNFITDKLVRANSVASVPRLIPTSVERDWIAVAPSRLESPEAGLGGFAKVDIPQGSALEIVGPDVPNNTPDTATLEYAFGYESFTTGERRAIHPLTVRNDGSYHEHCIAARFNHAPAPRAQLAVSTLYDTETGKDRCFMDFIRDVKAGEEIFVDYGADYWKGRSFEPVIVTETVKRSAEPTTEAPAKRSRPSKTNTLPADAAFSVPQPVRISVT